MQRLLVVLLFLVVGSACSDHEQSSAPGPISPPKPTGSAPSVLVITLDTTRADRLGCYGSERDLTPAIDAFARRSHLFERCESAVPLTLPAHMTLFTGLIPIRHGIRRNYTTTVNEDLPLLAETFWEHGYATAAFVSAIVVAERFGLAPGFDLYDGPIYNGKHDDKLGRLAESTLSRAQEWMLANPGPSFVWVHLWDPHYPYSAPEPFRSRFEDQPYDGEIAYLDHQLGLFLDTLEEVGRLDSGITVIAGDHGEAFGEHGEVKHGILLFDETTRVPLLIRLPNQEQAVRHQQSVGLVDLAATLREAAGVTTHDGDGSSLMPHMTGNEAQPDHSVYLETIEGNRIFAWAPLQAIVEGRWKYVHGPEPELYDLDEDPNESRRLEGRETEIAARLRTTLETCLASSGSTAEATEVAVDAEERRALLALGYVVGSSSAPLASQRNPMQLVHLLEPIQDGMIALADQDRQRAAVLFAGVLEEDPGNPIVLQLLGDALVADDPERAIDVYSEAIEAQPDLQPPYEKLAQIYLYQNRAAAAADVAADGIRATGDVSGALHFYKAAGGLASGARAGLAMSDLSTALRRNTTNWQAYRLRAALHLGNRNRDAALRDLESMSKWAPAGSVASLANDRLFRELHNEQRFRELVINR